jgi:hypothetical protein
VTHINQPHYEAYSGPRKTICADGVSQ